MGVVLASALIEVCGEGGEESGGGSFNERRHFGVVSCRVGWWWCCRGVTVVQGRDEEVGEELWELFFFF